MDHRLSPCRSCGAEIIWAETVNGKRIPLDAEPNSEGTFDLSEPIPGCTPEATYTKKGTAPELMSHFATCPEAASWRRT